MLGEGWWLKDVEADADNRITLILDAAGFYENTSKFTPAVHFFVFEPKVIGPFDFDGMFRLEARVVLF